MKIVKHLIWIIPIAIVFAVSCAKEVYDTTATADEIDCESIVYETDIEPLFEQHCTGCHQAGGQGPGDFTQLENIQAQKDEIKSEAVIKGTMPPSGAMSDAERELLGQWIDCGAMGTGVSYATDVSPILDTYCVGCHTTRGSAPGDFSIYDDVKNAVDNKQLENRVFVAQDMPPGGELNATERQILYNWLQAGAPNN